MRSLYVFGLVCSLLQWQQQQAIAEADVFPLPVSNSSEMRVAIAQRIESAMATVALFRLTPEFPAATGADLLDLAVLDAPRTPLPVQLGLAAIIRVNEVAGTVDLLTRAHVLAPLVFSQPIEGEELRIVVRFSRSRSYQAKMVALDCRSDLAVIRVKLDDALKQLGLHALELGEGEALIPGAEVLCSGSPWERVRTGRGSIHFGLVANSGKSFLISPDGRNVAISGALNAWVQLDVSQNSAVSGGALVSDEGKLAGSVSARRPQGSPEGDAPVALPFDLRIRSVIANLQSGYEVEYGDAGIRVATVSAQQFPGLPALAGRQWLAQVKGVVSSAPAESAGVKVGDLILAVNQQQVTSGSDFVSLIGSQQPGTDVELTLFRPASRSMEHFSVQLNKWVSEVPAFIATAHRHPDWRGLRVDFTGFSAFENNGESRNENLPSAFVAGVKVTHVLAGSPSAEAGLKVGDLIIQVGEQPVDSPAEFQDALQYWTGSVPVTLSGGREVLVKKDP